MASMIPRRTRRYEDLSLSARRRMVAGSLLRSGLTAGVLVTVYYLVPLNQLLDSQAVIGLLAGLVVFTVTIAWQIREITRSDIPRLRAMHALAVGLPVLLLTFALTYVVLDDNQAASFTEPLNRTDSLYFTVTVFATVGFGDIAPVSGAARVIVTMQMLVDLVVIGVLAKVVLGAVQVSVRRRTAAGRRAPDGPGPQPGPE